MPTETVPRGLGFGVSGLTLNPKPQMRVDEGIPPPHEVRR